jgi:formylglycine-generating enzyme required for sulfatase activity/uncharacterized caspase-like protein
MWISIRLGFAAFVAIAACFDTVVAHAEDTGIQKRAIVIGVSKYLKHDFEPLRYADNDATDTAEELRGLGFDVTLLVSQDASLGSLTAALKKFFASLPALNRDDVAIVMLTGHGMQFSTPQNGQVIEEPYFCPADGFKSKPETLISINWIMKELENSGSSRNLLIVDACRNNPAKGAKGVDGSTVRQLPTNISVLFSSSSGQQSYESDEVKHGVFTYVLLNGLRGAAHNGAGDITWMSLAEYMMAALPAESERLTGNPNLKQTPNFVGNICGNIVFVPRHLNASQDIQKPRDIQKPDVLRNNQAQNGENADRSDNVLEMTFVKCSPGNLATRAAAQGAQAGDFWIGKYEVTQVEWQSLMGNNPSYFSPHGRGSARIASQDTSRYPVEQVSYKSAQDFCSRLQERESASTRLPAGLEYRLPTSAEWELAAREQALGAAAGDKTLAGWFLQSSDYQTHAVGTVPGDKNRVLDMRGNVAEWCLKSGATPAPTLRGGSWNESAVTIGEDEVQVPVDQGRNTYGFRVVLAPKRNIQLAP